MWAPRAIALCTCRSNAARCDTSASAASLFSGSSGLGSCDAWQNCDKQRWGWQGECLPLERHPLQHQRLRCLLVQRVVRVWGPSQVKNGLDVSVSDQLLWRLRGQFKLDEMQAAAEFSDGVVLRLHYMWF